MNEHFYSDYACTLISLWPAEVARLIHQFAIQKIAEDKQKVMLLPTRVTSRQINEAQDESFELIKEYLSANAKWQEILNTIDETQLKLISDKRTVIWNIKLFLDNKTNTNINTGFTLDELNSDLSVINNQAELPLTLQTDLAKWRKDELNTLMEKWVAYWLQHNKIYADKLMTTLKEKWNIELSDLEKQEFYTPTKNRAELLADLKNFYPDRLPKGYKEDSSLFKLRVLWTISAYQKRTLMR